MTEDGHVWVTVTEAVRLTGKSERTVRRWMTGGKVETRVTLAGLEVGLTGNMVNSDRQPQATPDTTDTVTALEADVRRLQALLDQVTGERDYLRSALAASLSTTAKLLPETTPTHSWWQFWKTPSHRP